MRLLQLGLGLTSSRTGSSGGATLPIPQNVLAEFVAVDTVEVTWDDPNVPGLAYMVRWRNPPTVDYTQARFDTVTDLGGRLMVSLTGATLTSYEIQVASIGADDAMSPWSNTAYCNPPPAAGYPALDYSKASNSAKWLYANGF